MASPFTIVRCSLKPIRHHHRENLTKVYRSGRIEVAAVRGVSFSVKRGEFIAIVAIGLRQIDALLLLAA